MAKPTANPRTTGKQAARSGTTSPRQIRSTVPSVSTRSSADAVTILQERLVALLDLQLTLKHIHWNVVGMNFIAVHQMLDPQVDAVREMSDAVAERIATMGGEPLGTPGAIVALRSWADYDIDRAPTVRHLMALDAVYSGVIEDHRAAQERLGELDPVSQDLFIGHLGQLELFQWFVRAHLKDSSGDVSHRSTEPAKQAGRRSRAASV
jgi:starvation-inducible DNA-binding protein